jgi:hypothetical protein
VHDQNKTLKTYTGTFSHVCLSIIPEPALTEKERSLRSPNYPTALGYVQVFLDGQNVSAMLPSGYILWILDSLLAGLCDLFSGKKVTAKWVSDSWQFDLVSDPANDRVYITLHMPGRWVVMHNVNVSLSQFGDCVVRSAKKWDEYLVENYHKEITRTIWDKQYLKFKQFLRNAESTIQVYKRGSLRNEC